MLDLGCGAGVPVARDLALAGHHVVGMDGSAVQIDAARRHVREATFIEADMCEAAFAPGSFDAVCAFYSITHVPPLRQPALVTSIATWLRAGGVLVASFGTGPASEWVGEWLGTRMFFGQLADDDTLRLIGSAGLAIDIAQVERQDDEDAAFLWVLARKPAMAG